MFLLHCINENFFIFFILFLQEHGIYKRVIFTLYLLSPPHFYQYYILNSLRVKRFADIIKKRKEMKILFLTCFLLCIVLYIPWSLDYKGIVLNSDSSKNQYLLTLFLSEDLTDQLCILTYLGRRADPYIEEFIFEIMDHIVHPNKDKYEYLLRVLLFSVFHPGFEEDELAARILINKKGIDHLVYQLHVFKDPLLKCQIMWTIPFLHDVSSFGFIMTEGNHLLSVVKKSQGMPGIKVNSEIICLLDTIQQIGDTDYLFLCNSFIKFSRNKEVVDKSRATIKILLLRESE